jgi:alkylated DNA repair protein (DNA oxidative demethylase)
MAQGLVHHPACLDQDAQRALVEALRICIAAAPLFTPVMPKTGRPFSVRMTNLGPSAGFPTAAAIATRPFIPPPAGPAAILELLPGCYGAAWRVSS